MSFSNDLLDLVIKKSAYMSSGAVRGPGTGGCCCARGRARSVQERMMASSIHQPNAEVSLAGSTDIVGRAEGTPVAGDWTAEGDPGWRGQVVFVFDLVDLARNASPTQNQISAGRLKVQPHGNGHGGGKG